MARLTNKQRAALRLALADAERAAAFIALPNVAVGFIGNPATTTLHYTRPDGSTFYEVSKEYGSDLVGLQSAIERLAAFLVRN